MPERFETDPFKNKYINLLKELEKYDISENDFNDYMHILEHDIEEEIEKAGRVPEYAYRMIIKEVIPYEYRESVYLELLCGFEIIKEKKEDLNDNTIRNGYMFPSSPDV